MKFESIRSSEPSPRLKSSLHSPLSSPLPINSELSALQLIRAIERGVNVRLSLKLKILNFRGGCSQVADAATPSDDPLQRQVTRWPQLPRAQRKLAASLDGPTFSSTTTQLTLPIIPPHHTQPPSCVSPPSLPLSASSLPPPPPSRLKSSRSTSRRSAPSRPRSGVH